VRPTFPPCSRICLRLPSRKYLGREREVLAARETRHSRDRDARSFEEGSLSVPRRRRPRCRLPAPLTFLGGFF